MSPAGNLRHCQSGRARPAALALAALALAALPAPAARADWREDFEGPEVTWREAGGDARYRIESRQRVSEGAHGGHRCERWKIVANDGSAVYLKHDAPPARLISEFSATVYVKSERPGLQLFVRVVLPRSRDPRTGKALTALLAGSGYTQAGAWQQLRVDNLPRSLERQLRVLRTQFGPAVDGREAYVDQVVLNVYGGPGITDVLIDDLELQGAVGGAAVATANEPAAPAASARPATADPAATGGSPSRGSPSGGGDVLLRGALLTVRGKPFFPRVIVRQGEPLARLQSLGFNTAQLSEPPQPELLAEAARLGMWLVCPPPPAAESAPGDAHTPRIGPEYAPVLAWDLGAGLSGSDLEQIKRRIKSLRAADPRDRPILAGAETALGDYSRLVDVLLAERPVIGTSLELSGYAQWLRDRPLLARPGTPLWAGVQTQPLARQQEQANLLAGRAVAIDRVQDEQIRQLAFTALAAGARGLLFQSASPLDAEDSATKRRAESLERLNLELELIEPWAAAGSFVTSAFAGDGHMQAAVIQTERGRLLLPLRTAGQSQLALGASGLTKVQYVVPGVPESNEAWELNPAGLRPLPHKRVAGGLSLTLGPGQVGSLVLLTQDALVIDFLSRRTAEFAQRGAALERDLSQRQLQFVQELDQRHAALGRALPNMKLSIASARTALGEAEAAAAGQQSALASYLASRRAIENLQLVERAYWEQGAVFSHNWLASPLTANVATIPEQWLFATELPSLRVQPNLLPAGNCENINDMTRAGWRLYQHPTPGVTSELVLATKIPKIPKPKPPKPGQPVKPPDPAAAANALKAATAAALASVYDGEASVHLKARPAQKGDGPPPVLETAPIWLTSPPVPTPGGALVWIHGWARILSPPAGNADGFLILESIGGEALAERLAPTSGWKDAERARRGQKPLPAHKKMPTDDWKEFSLYRVAPKAGPLTVTFALCGLGDVWLDDITVHVIERTGPLPMNPAVAAPPDWMRPRRK